jgi:phosphonoacetate hydrolase
MDRQLSLFICLDGCSPEYLRAARTPVMDSLASQGVYQLCRAMTPTVTNLNHATLATGCYPESHGITGNYALGANGRPHYTEEGEQLLSPAIFEVLNEHHVFCVLITVKEKLGVLIGRGASLSISAEAPPGWLVEAIGPPPSIYSLEVNFWIFQALEHILKEYQDVAFVYITTTDYPQHFHEPESEPSISFIQTIDSLLGRILDLRPHADVAITADHGMNQKTRGLDPEKILGSRGIESISIPVIRDRYVVHHGNMGGAAYVYLGDSSRLRDAQELLSDVEGVEAVLTRKEAASIYHLPSNRIGDLLLLGDKNTAFGSMEDASSDICIRSHGSLHEIEVPVIATGRFTRSTPFRDVKELASWIRGQVFIFHKIKPSD